MAKSPWIPLFAAVAVLALSTVITMALPETLPVQESALEGIESDDDSTFEMRDKRKTWTDGFVRFKESFAFATCNATVMALILCLFVSQVGTQCIDLLLQYVSKRYGWSLSKVSFQEGFEILISDTSVYSGWAAIVTPGGC